MARRWAWPANPSQHEPSILTPRGTSGGSESAGRSGSCSPPGRLSPKIRQRPITSFKTAWIKVRRKAGVKGRWHDNRHTLVTELAESGAGDEVIMSIAS